ncbi:MAG: hypothetical protein Q4D96_08665 [Propionibacteriaceae bacterium]|nr:hypothetical protein [Propionibacteriaceae bacterium]
MRRLDLPTLLTGLVLTGFAGVGLWFGTGMPQLVSGKMWFAAVLLAVGTLGLMLGLSRGPHDKN